MILMGGLCHSVRQGFLFDLPQDVIRFVFAVGHHKIRTFTGLPVSLIALAFLVATGGTIHQFVNIVMAVAIKDLVVVKITG